jgi:hypothetical protein
VKQTLQVDTTGVQAMATRWIGALSDLAEAVGPAGLALSCQTSAAAVNSAHLDVAAFAAGLSARVGERATGIAQADTSYLVQEAVSAIALAAVAEPAVGV